VLTRRFPMQMQGPGRVKIEKTPCDSVNGNPVGSMRP
jgi:hypothetical protein